MAAALMTMTQCRKQETVPATPSADTIKMTITAGPGAKTDITNEGAITWTSGDVLYVSDGANWLGSLTLNSAQAMRVARSQEPSKGLVMGRRPATSSTSAKASSRRHRQAPPPPASRSPRRTAAAKVR